MSMVQQSTRRLELWGGIECSYNRVNDDFFDQLLYCGHYARIEEDIEAIGSLGIRALRYPITWERIQPSRSSCIDWSLVDRALNAMQRNSIRPIVGLVHHGSGQDEAGLLSPHFSEGLSSFARQVAERYPWLDTFIPINEPLTTARFSGLYGMWYPHMKSDHAFVTSLVNQLKAVVLSMNEIRKVNPAAKLVQGEDLAKIYSTPRLQYQTDFENNRRWLTWDFLCGKVGRDHRLWDYLISSGADEHALRFFQENSCPPDIIGVDYYITSERYLDERLELFPPHTHGGNRVDTYADVEAFRVPHGQPSGLKLLLSECWDRYNLPMAITECHINSDAINQIRWLAEVRHTAKEMIERGMDIAAVTSWALFGSFGWNTLLTTPGGHYESGAFDVRGGVPTHTPLAEYISRVIDDPYYIDPSEKEKGWWHSDQRFILQEQELSKDNKNIFYAETR